MSDRSRNRAHTGNTDDWLTPPEIVKLLGPFDLDPCCPPVMPWRTARRMYREGLRDGLALPWSGVVWMNPPYSRPLPWVERFVEHGNGIALVPAKSTDTRWCQLLLDGGLRLFMAGRLNFCLPDGTPTTVAWGPSLFVALGRTGISRLRRSGLPGAYL